MKETQKAIEAEFEDFDKQWLKTVHKSGAKYYGLECYVAGRSKSLEEKEKEIQRMIDMNQRLFEKKQSELQEKEKRVRELEEALRMLQKPENREHMISIASAALSGELGRELLNQKS